MSKLWSLLIILGFVLFACKTSGDLRAEKTSSDPGDIKTVTSQFGNSQSQNTKPRNSPPPMQPTGSSRMANEELLRQVEVLKGEVQEQTYLKDQLKNQYDSKIASLESDKARYLEEIQILKGAAPQAGAKGGDLIWDTAQKDITSKNYEKASTSLKEFLENFPQDQRVESALLLKGQTEYAAGDFKTSLVSFGQYLDKYPKGKERAMAWLGQAVALIRMKQKKDAKLFLDQCVTLFPKSREAKLARRLQKNPNVVPSTLFNV